MIDRNDFDKKLIVKPDDPNESGHIEIGQPDAQDCDDYAGAVATLKSVCCSDEGWILGPDDARAIAEALLKLVNENE